MRKIYNVSYFKGYLLYLKHSGNFMWKASCGSVRAGSIAGTINHKGYRVININGKLWQSHRLVWLFSFGEFPENQIDHIDGNRLNNHISNLRCVTNRENCKNRKIPANNSTGVIGVGFNTKTGKYIAYINIESSQRHLGSFDTVFDAACVRKSYEIKHGYHENHGRA